MEFAATCFRSASLLAAITKSPGSHLPKEPSTLQSSGSTYLLRMQLCDASGQGLLERALNKGEPNLDTREEGRRSTTGLSRAISALGPTSWRGFVEDYGDFVNGAIKKHASSNSSEGITISWQRRCQASTAGANRGCSPVTSGTSGALTVRSHTLSPRSTPTATCSPAICSPMSRFQWGNIYEETLS